MFTCDILKVSIYHLHRHLLLPAVLLDEELAFHQQSDLLCHLVAGLAQESLTRTQDQYLPPTLDTRSRGNFPADYQLFWRAQLHCR